MATVAVNRFRGKVRDDYLASIRSFPLTSIRSEDEFEAAQKIMDRLLANERLSAGVVMYLDALSDLVGSYEDQHYPITPASDAAMLRHLMEAKGITQAELHRGTGIAKSTISEVLAGKKPFSRQMIRTLAEFFDVDARMLAANI